VEILPKRVTQFANKSIIFAEKMSLNKLTKNKDFFHNFCCNYFEHLTIKKLCASIE